MQSQSTRSVSGHVYRHSGKRGDVWRVKYRLPDGRQVHRKLGPVWTGKGRPLHGSFTRRTAQAALQAILTDARRGTLLGMTTTGATFADAAAEWMRHGEQERGWKPSTVRDYRSAVRVHLLPTFGPMRLEDVSTARIEAWRSRRMAEGLTPRNAVKLLAILHGIFGRARRVWGLAANPAADVERIPLRYRAEGYSFYSPQEIQALVRAAVSEQDGAMFLVAALAGLRLGEVLALRVRDVDFEAESIRVMGSVDAVEGVGTTKSGRGRTVPMVPDVAHALARMLTRDRFTAAEDFVFVGEAGRHVDGSALRRRYRAAQARAGLPPLRFHDLRHTFGSLAINVGSQVEVQAWMGHADVRTTARYLHYRRRADEARRLAEAFRVEEPSMVAQT
jgi:integrase